MRKFVLIVASLLLVVSCKEEENVEAEIAEVTVDEVKIDRFDQKFFEGTPDDLPKLKAEYSYLFPPSDPDEVWVNKMKDTFHLRLYDEVQKLYANTTVLEDEFEDLFKHMKYYYPNFRSPKVIALVSDDIETKTLYTKDFLFIPFSLYLGGDNYLYKGMPQYKVEQFDSSQILPDAVVSFSNNKIEPPRDRTLLELMVYFGKELYMKDILLPDTTDAVKMGYTPEDIAWAQANESEMWRYFIDKSLLYSTDPKLPSRFISPAPFSKFYLEFDNESPGRLGSWLGWQIVRAYVENNKNVTLQELLAMDAKTIFENSKYKPKKE
ncbi:MAG: gliding motility lipoprotein GldB [Flavobacterium sp. MedPE-SWcel]|uniref:gliding motility lipoprotein GldB n=1 Tax=uncultured Flavobacterium sp. TaxID=165435 RepID=UPI00090EDF38|nr:gliding motility lipoprotein GldB [uncultured Flavobacterium sp.]OIQ22534.1 MAG: gliding motility lipoprotein GldB [Flavobacterium sp. MedPE-SWcel]